MRRKGERRAGEERKGKERSTSRLRREGEEIGGWKGGIRWEMKREDWGEKKKRTGKEGEKRGKEE